MNVVVSTFDVPSIFDVYTFDIVTTTCTMYSLQSIYWMLAVVGENKPRRAATPFGGGGVDGGGWEGVGGAIAACGGCDTAVIKHTHAHALW